MDNSMPRFYIKVADASGMCTIKSYDFAETQDTPKTEYVSKAEFDDLKNKISQYKEMFHNYIRPSDNPIQKPTTSSETRSEERV